MYDILKYAYMPNTFEEAVNILKTCNNKEECVEKAYELVTRKYRGYRIKTYTNLFSIFLNDIEKLWRRTGFMHCTQINSVIEQLLIASGHFTNGDIRKRWTQIWLFSPHQFLQIQINNNKWINVDAWSHPFGISLGDYAHGFHSGHIKGEKL